MFVVRTLAVTATVQYGLRSIELEGEVVWGASAADHCLLVTEVEGGLNVRSEHVVTGEPGPSCFWEVAV